jgi:hypothetical protein
MKKMLFSAIALVAFTVTSMAGEIKPVEKEIKSETPCADQWVRDMNDLQGGFGATYEEALICADRCFEKCLETTYGID